MVLGDFLNRKKADKPTHRKAPPESEGGAEKTVTTAYQA